MKNSYVKMASAQKKLELAQSMNTAVYVYGATGYGKTKLVENYLGKEKAIWLSADETEYYLSAELEKISSNLEKGSEKRKNKIVVIDDLQFMFDTEIRQQIIALSEREDIWLILIGRTPAPQWLAPVFADGRLMVVKEELLHFSAVEVKKLAVEMGVSVSDEDVDVITTTSKGNAYVISFTFQMIRSGEIFNDELSTRIRDIFVNHLENDIISQWKVVVQEFMMKLSVVNSFTLPLAVMITGDDQAAALIEESMNMGNFIEKKGDEYIVKDVLLMALRRKALKAFGYQEYNKYICNAGHFYEMKDDIITALALYEEAEATSNIRTLLIRNGRRHPGVGHYYELRHYYMALEEKDVVNSPILMNALCMLYSVLMNVEKSEYWYNKLKEYSKTVKAGERREADEMLLYLDIGLPHRGSFDIKDIIVRTASLMKSGGVKLPEMSITNNEPSTMNGGKDFCTWSKKDQFMADTIGRTLEKVMGKGGRGLSNAALCESFYEKGGRDTEVSHLAMLAQMEVEGGGNLEIMFATIGIQARLSMVKGKKSNTKQLLDAFSERLDREHNNSIRPMFKALYCRMALMAGDAQVYEEWIKEAPNEHVDFCTLERYKYMTKAYWYIFKGQNDDAINLLDKMLCYSKMYERTYIYMEALLLMSIALKREKREWKEEFLECLHMISEYQFVRIISEKGAGVLPLLKEIRNEYLARENADATWFSKVKNETEMIAKYYPAYLSGASIQPADFGDVAMSILRMQAEGFSIKEIAEQHDLSERTIKYHAAENYRKLNAKGKTDAVQKARNMNLI